MTKVCKVCGIEKDLALFAKRKAGRFGVEGRCRECRNTWERVYRTIPEVRETLRLRRKEADFGPDANIVFARLQTAQNNLCALCNQPEITKAPSGATRDLNIDHDHTSGKIRGLLCIKCNTLVGRIEKNIELLPLLLSYIGYKAVSH